MLISLKMKIDKRQSKRITKRGIIKCHSKLLNQITYIILDNNISVVKIYWTPNLKFKDNYRDNNFKSIIILQILKWRFQKWIVKIASNKLITKFYLVMSKKYQYLETSICKTNNPLNLSSQKKKWYDKPSIKLIFPPSISSI